MFVPLISLWPTCEKATTAVAMDSKITKIRNGGGRRRNSLNTPDLAIIADPTSQAEVRMAATAAQLNDVRADSRGLPARQTAMMKTSASNATNARKKSLENSETWGMN